MKLSINIDKAKWTIFHPTSKKCFMPKKFPELFELMALKRETVTKFLGVFIDENVTWKPHITKISKTIGILYEARLIIPRKQLNQLYFSFVHIYLSCCKFSLGFYPENQIVYSLSSTKALN